MLPGPVDILHFEAQALTLCALNCPVLSETKKPVKTCFLRAFLASAEVKTKGVSARSRSKSDQKTVTHYIDFFD